MRRIHRGILAGTLALAGMAIPAQAASIADLLVAGQGARGFNTLVDDNREYLIDREGTVRGRIDVGDSLRGMAIWSKLNGHALGLGTQNNELTTVFQILVTSKNETSAGQFSYTFGPDPDFQEAVDLGMGGQAMMIFWEDSTPNAALDYNDPASPLPANSIDDGTTLNPPSSADVGIGPYGHEEAFIATAKDGTLFWALGFTGSLVNGAATAANGEGWVTNRAITDNVLDFFSINSGTDLASMNFALNRLDSSGTGDDLLLSLQPSSITPGASVEFNGSSTLEGVYNELTPFEISSQSTLTFAIIPLPPAAWMGMALLSSLGTIGWVRRKLQAA